MTSSFWRLTLQQQGPKCPSKRLGVIWVHQPWQVYAQIPELMILDLYIASPVLVVPWNNRSNATQSCWMFFFFRKGWLFPKKNEKFFFKQNIYGVLCILVWMDDMGDRYGGWYRNILILGRLEESWMLFGLSHVIPNVFFVHTFATSNRRSGHSFRLMSVDKTATVCWQHPLGLDWSLPDDL